MSDTALTTGETSAVTITFSEKVTGFDNSDVTVQNGSLSTLSTSDGGTTWTGTFTPATNTTSNTDVITVGSGYTDIAGNTGSGLTSANYTVHTAVNTGSAPLTISDAYLGMPSPRPWWATC